MSYHDPDQDERYAVIKVIGVGCAGLHAVTHFQHSRIIDFCKRPFASHKEMDAVIFRNWNAVVRPDDTVYHLGDVAFGDVERLLPCLRGLMGKKYLVPGNHDEPKKLELLAEVFEILPALTEVTLPLTRKAPHVRAVLCHYAMTVWNGSHNDRIMLYGHSHGRLPGNSRSLDVGVDAWNFYPVRLQDILKRLEKSPAFVQPDMHGRAG